MINFNERKVLKQLKAEVGDIDISISEELLWDKEKKQSSDNSVFRISVSFKNDNNYNAVDLTSRTEEEAKLLAEDAVEFLQKVRSVLEFSLDS